MSARGVNTHGSFGHALGRVRHLARAYPTLVRVGVSDLVAYRAEFLVWILTMNLPLIMMALWSAVAADGPSGASARPSSWPTTWPCSWSAS
jgi:hypothetical protein